MKKSADSKDAYHQVLFRLSVTLYNSKSVYVEGTGGVYGFEIRVKNDHGPDPEGVVLRVDSNGDWIGRIDDLTPGVKEYEVQARINDMPYATATLHIPKP
ncbi:hypothetical protein [Pseudomonas vanderleydeniana]|uniref:Uncharacterized protein n=1 Tax=Pseudomonas vanderleydeniana TaxID=2745495 RepID=A0A9E6PQG3_9PSED|nr:hypothetical protein [Pseudomonas vanderleydeniana]QXI31192.1 hypothetical protein HU752_015200 [Pseudomonas vanderleydeniana]